MLSKQLTNDERAMVVYIETTVVQSRVKRTTEIWSIADDLGLTSDEAKTIVRDLVTRGYLRCSTEKWEDYCYIITPSTPLPNHQKVCAPFAL